MIQLTKKVIALSTLGMLSACGGGGGAAETPKQTIQQEQPKNDDTSTPEDIVIVEGFELFNSLLTSEQLNIFEITNCGDTPSANSSHIVLLNSEHAINGDTWNHIDDNNSAWDGVTKLASDYGISRTANGSDVSCNDVATYNSILVKKYGDWDQQHANGYYVNSATAVTFAKLDTLIFDIYYDSALSNLPSTADIKAAYGNLTDEQLSEWDDGEFQLNIQLDDSTGNFHAALNLSLASDYADKWLRIEAPVSQLEIWRSSGYDSFSSDYDELSTKTFSKVGFVAETKNRAVYRGYDQDGFNIDSTPKLFKEIAFRVKRFDISTEE